MITTPINIFQSPAYSTIGSIRSIEEQPTPTVSVFDRIMSCFCVCTEQRERESSTLSSPDQYLRASDYFTTPPTSPKS